MNKLIYIVSLVVLLSSSTVLNAQESKQVDLANFDAEVLNQELYKSVQSFRSKKKTKDLKQSSALAYISKKWQSILEFRSFSNGEKIQSKINKKLPEDGKKSAYQGSILESIALQVNGIKFQSDEAYVYDKKSSDKEFGLYYGTRKELKKDKSKRRKIELYTYEELANEIINQLSSKQKKLLKSPSYQDIGLHVQWNYKTLHRRKIPQMKAIFILGGMQTIGIR